jgi:hypothetical protein
MVMDAGFDDIDVMDGMDVPVVDGMDVPDVDIPDIFDIPAIVDGSCVWC